MSISVSLVTYRSRPWIDACLAGVRAQGRRVCEVLVADNGGDATAQHLRAQHQGVSVRELGCNAGFAAGHNANFARARGRYFLALNPDVVLEAGYLERLARCLDAVPTLGAVQGTLLAPDVVAPGKVAPGQVAPCKVGPGLVAGGGEARLDSAGIRWSRGRTRFLDRGRGEPAARYACEEDVFGACGAAALYRASALRAVSRPGESPYAESLFMYYEDVDLAWRLRHAGWRSRFVPAARATHQRGGSRAHPAFVEYHLVRNRLWVSLRNASPRELLRELPGLALFEGAKLVQSIVRPHLRRALRDQLRGVPAALAARGPAAAGEA